MFEMGGVEIEAGVGEIGVDAVEVGACTVDVGAVRTGAGAAKVDVGAVVIRGGAVLRFEGLGLGGSSSVLSVPSLSLLPSSLLLASSLSPLSLLLASLLLLLPSLPSSFDSRSLSLASDAGSAVVETSGSRSVRGCVLDIEGRGGREDAVGARAGRSGGAMVVPSSVSRFSTLGQNVSMLAS